MYVEVCVVIIILWCHDGISGEHNLLYPENDIIVLTCTVAPKVSEQKKPKIQCAKFDFFFAMLLPQKLLIFDTVWIS